MKPFNLEAALAGDPVITRDGRDVKIAGYNLDAPYRNQIVGWVGNEVYCWNFIGRYQGYETDTDIFMKPKKQIVWINLYPRSCYRYNSEKEADINAGTTRIGNKAYPIEIDE